MAHGSGLYQCRTGQVNSFIIDTRGSSSTKLFDVVVAGPQDMAVPVRCYQQKDGNLLAQFTAPVSGGYRIDVLYDGKPLRGSPFTAQAFDAQKVTVDNVRSASVSVHEPISFQSELLPVSFSDAQSLTVLSVRPQTVRKREAGMAAIDVTVVTPTSKELPLEVKSNGDGDWIEYHPTIPGKYSFNVVYGGEAIPGTFFIIDLPKSSGFVSQTFQIFRIAVRFRGGGRRDGQSSWRGFAAGRRRIAGPVLYRRQRAGGRATRASGRPGQHLQVSNRRGECRNVPSELHASGGWHIRRAGLVERQGHPRVAVPSARLQPAQSPRYRRMGIAGGQSEQAGASGRRGEEDQFRHAGRRTGRLVGRSQRPFRPSGGDERGDADAAPDAAFFHSAASRRVRRQVAVEPRPIAQCSARGRHRPARRPAQQIQGQQYQQYRQRRRPQGSADGQRAGQSHDWRRGRIHHRRIACRPRNSGSDYDGHQIRPECGAQFHRRQHVQGQLRAGLYWRLPAERDVVREAGEGLPAEGDGQLDGGRVQSHLLR